MADPYWLNQKEARPDGAGILRRSTYATLPQYGASSAPTPTPSLATSVGRSAAEGGLARLPGWMTAGESEFSAVPKREFRAAPRAGMTTQPADAPAPEQRRGWEPNINYRPADQLGGWAGASIGAVDDETKASMRRDQFMRDLGRQKFDSARRAVADAYTGDERNRTELQANEVRSRAEVGAAMTRANAGIAEANARGAMDAQIANVEGGLKRREQDISLEAAAAKGALTPKDLLEMDKTRLEMAKLTAEQARAADQYEQTRPGLLEKTISPRIEAMRKAGVPEDRIAVEAAKDAMRLGLDPNSSPTAAAGRDAALQRIESLYNQNDFTPINVWGLGDEGAPGSSLTARGLTPGSLQDFNAVRAGETGLLRRTLLGAPRYRYEVTGEDGRPNVRYSDDEQTYNDINQLRRLSRRSE